MVKEIMFLSLLSLIVASPIAVYADDSHDHGAAEESVSQAPDAVPAAPEAAKSEDAVAEIMETLKVNNKICPVGGEKVGEMGPPYEVVHNGKTYHLCCEMCAEEFRKDPDKYSKVADDEVASATAAEPVTQ